MQRLALAEERATAAEAAADHLKAQEAVMRSIEQQRSAHPESECPGAELYDSALQ